MLFRYDKTLEWALHPTQPLAEERSPAWQVLCLVRELDRWFDLPHRTLYQSGDARIQIGYLDASLPVAEYGEEFGTLLAGIGEQWPVWSVGAAFNGEVAGLSFSCDDGVLTMRQHNTSGVWQRELRGLYLNVQLPDADAAECLAQLLRIEGRGAPVAALEWKYADFLEQQELTEIDRTLSFCYVQLAEEAGLSDRLAGLSLEQKQCLWWLFLERRVYPPEFEWLWSELAGDWPLDWTEWVLALYRTLDELQFRLICQGNQFELLDSAGRRIYFGADHDVGAAEQVFMKAVFALNGPLDDTGKRPQ